MMNRFGSRLLSAFLTPASCSIGRNRIFTRPLSGMHEFFEQGQALPIYEPGKAPVYGRAWKPDELRLKSFEDLHKLWFVLLKERNLLATQKAEAQRLGQRWFGTSRVFKARLSMARIKTVLMERQRMHSTAKHLMAIKEGGKVVPAGSELMIGMERKERLSLLKGKRKFRKAQRRHHPLL